jgi:hypothetical protein
MEYRPDGKPGLNRLPGQYDCRKCGESYSNVGGYDSGICTSCFIVETEAWDNGAGTGEFIDGVWYKNESTGCVGVFSLLFIFLLSFIL